MIQAHAKFTSPCFYLIAQKSVSVSLAFRFASTSSFVPPWKPDARFENEDPEESISNRTYWTKKIHRLCTKNRNVDDALRLLPRLTLRGYRPDSLNLSSIIHALCDSHRFVEALQRFSLFIASDCVPDEGTCNVLIARLPDSRKPHSTLLVIQRLIGVKPEFVPSLVNYNRLMDQLCSIARPSECCFVHSSVQWVLQEGDQRYAHKVFDEMSEHGVMPNSLTYGVMIRGILRKRDLEGGKEMMCKLWKRMNSEEDQALKTAAFANLIDFLCAEGFFNEVFRIAEDLPQGNSVSEEVANGRVIDSLCKVGRYHGAVRKLTSKTYNNQSRLSFIQI